MWPSHTGRRRRGEASDMSYLELERLLRELAQAEIDDEALHKRPSTLGERVQSHDRLTRLRAETARLRKEFGVASMVRHDDDGGNPLPPRP